VNNYDAVSGESATFEFTLNFKELESIRRLIKRARGGDKTSAPNPDLGRFSTEPLRQRCSNAKD
jgi:hypothetical protein